MDGLKKEARQRGIMGLVLQTRLQGMTFHEIHRRCPDDLVGETDEAIRALKADGYVGVNNQYVFALKAGAEWMRAHWQKCTICTKTVDYGDEWHTAANALGGTELYHKECYLYRLPAVGFAYTCPSCGMIIPHCTLDSLERHEVNVCDRVKAAIEAAIARHTAKQAQEPPA